MNIFIVLLLSVLVAGSPVWAEEKIQVGEVVITAARIAETLEETTSDVTVITGKEIKERNITFVPDVFRLVPEINVVGNGADGKFASVFLRGGAPTHTLVMIDGVKVNSTTTGSFDFAHINTDDIERIEIVKGPQSTLYGSEAMAGVINIITKKGEGKPKAAVSFEGGSYGTYKPAASVSGSAEAYDYRVTASYFHTDGISVAKDGDERDSYENGALSWKFGFRPTKNAELEITGDYTYARTELDDFDFMTRKAIDAFNFVQYGHSFLLSGRGKLYLFDIWEQILTVSAMRESLIFRDPNSFFNNADIINKRQTVDWQHNVYLSNAVTLTAGFEYRNEEGENSGNFEDSVDNKAVYALAKVKLFDDRLVLNAGLRYDDHETAGSKTTYRIGAVYTIKEAALSFRGSYATGFRAPSLNDLYFPFYGNPSLEPEETKAWEVGIDKTLLDDRLALSLTYFDQKYDDLIEFDPFTFTAANIAKAKIRGVEASASFKITNAFSVKAGYTYLDTEDEETGNDLTRRPSNKVSVGVGYTGADFTIITDFVYVGERFNSASLDTLSSYSLVNVSGNYKVSKDVTIFARVENLFNKDYEEASGFGTKGTSVYGGVKASF